MYDPAVLRFALISGLFGFAAFCVSYALLVWRRRNRAVAGPRFSPARALRRWSACLVLVGILTMGITVAVRELDRAEGVLSSDGLYAIRMPDDAYCVTYLAEAEQVREGDLVARLESPAAEAQVQQLELQCQRLEKERDALRLRALDLDHELVRHHQNSITLSNQLRASIGQLLPEHESVTRQATTEQLTRREKIAKLEVDIAWHQGELAQANSRRDFVARELERAMQLVGRNAVAQSEVDARKEQQRDADAEVANLEKRIEGMREEKTQLEKSLAEIAQLAAQQRQTLVAELDRARSDYLALESQAPDWTAKLEVDLKRARDLRQRELEQLDLKIQECRAEAAGVQKTLSLRAPYDGRVVYCDPSPRSAERHQPLFVLARNPGFRLQVRLPRSQLDALRQAGDVTWGLVDRSVEPYFGGTFLDARPLPRKPRYVVAELACQPPKDAIRDLLDGQRIVARLQWRPPLATLQIFRVGARLGLAGLAGWVVSLFGYARRPSQERRAKECVSGPRPHAGFAVPTTSTAVWAPSPDGSETELDGLESGSVAAIHELLGERLREAILRNHVDRELISAVQWALDRHHFRAVRQLRIGLGRDDELEARVRRLCSESRSHGDNGSTPRRDREQLLQVLNAIDPDLIDLNSSRCPAAT